MLLLMKSDSPIEPCELPKEVVQLLEKEINEDASAKSEERTANSE